MRTRYLPLGVLGAALLPAIAAASIAPAPQSVAIQPGQGTAFTLSIPAAPTAQPPYALTGQTAPTPRAQPRLLPVRTGQGDLVWLRLSK